MTDLQRRIAALSPKQRELLERRLADLTASRIRAPEDRIDPRDATGPAPLAIQQQREWTFAQYRAANNIPGAFRVEGELDLALLGSVLTEVVERHEVLRSTVELAEDGARVQVVHPATPVPTPVVDLTHLSPEERQEEVRRRWEAEVVGPFDPAQPQRLRVSLLRLDGSTHVVLITTDHAAADLGSVGILVEEFAALYAMRRGGGPGELPPVKIQYGDYAAWQRNVERERKAAELEHWRRVLDGIPGGLALPSDRPYPAEPTFAGGAYRADLSPELTAELRRFTEREKTAIGVVLVAACAVLLYRYLDQDDVVIGEIVSGRNRSEIEQLIGCFVGALPLRMRLADDQTLREIVRQARDTVVTAYDHQDLPFDSLLEQLDLGPEVNQASLMDMWLDVRTPERTLALPGMRITAEPVESSLAATPLTLDANPNTDELQLRWLYMTELFDESTVVVLADQFRRILARLVTAPDTPVGELELAVAPPVAAEVAPASAGFVELFQRRVAVAPYAPAVVWDGVPTSYADLNRDANRLAHHLRARGVGRESRVGILLDRTPSLTVAILGVLKTGAAYVPLDPGYPPDRLAFMLADAEVTVLLTGERLAGALAGVEPAPAYEAVLVDDPSTLDGQAEDDPAEAPDLDALAYVVYTSGSTGRPKGAMIEHGSLVTFARDVVDRLGLGTGDRFLQFASPSFDVLVEELFPTWLAGGCVVFPARPLLGGGDDLAELIERERLTVIELPTAYWHEWVRELERLDRTLPDCLRLVIIGGERVLPERLAGWRRRLPVPLAHVYGLTETTVSSTFFRLDPADPVTDWPNLPIGTPLPSADLRVLDRRLRPVPVGATGELYIGGVSLARGYLARPGLTAQRFVADPEPARPGQRLYRTGDLVRQRADGNLEFIGRVDTQIKIRGFRVEPMEIESVLSRHPQVAESVVAVHEPAPGDRRLVAYVVPGPRPDGAEPLPAELRQYLERELPAYLVPAAFVELDALPLTPNGKVDRRRLPAPDGDRPEVGEEYVEPRSPVERTLADIVAAVVGLARVGAHDNFFEIGGDSILAIQVVARAQEAGLRLTPFDLFAHPTVSALSGVAAAGPTVDAEQSDVTGPVPLAPAQRWFALSGIEEPHHWNRSVLLDLAAPGDARLLGTAVSHLLAHHDGLRQRFLLAGERSQVRIAPRGDVTPFAVYDLADLAEADGDRRSAELVAEAQASLDLAVGPLVRFALLTFGGRRPDQLAVVAHRLVADDVSIRVLLEDLATALAQLAAGRQVKLPAKTTSWQSWSRRLIAYAATPPVQSQRAYWSELVAGPSAGLPVDTEAEPAANTVASAATVTATLDAETTGELLRAAPEALTCTVDELLLAALSRTLSGWTGAPRHLVAVERHDRPRISDEVDLSRTVGWFSATHPVALTAEPGSAEATLKAVKEALRAVPTGGIGWQMLRQEPDPPPPAATDLAFTYLGEVDQPASGAFTVVAEPVGADESPRGRRPYLIEVAASVAGGRLAVRWRYSEHLHARQTLEDLAARYVEELRALVELGRLATGPVYTPSDFPLARVDPAQLDSLLGRLRSG
ncbi:amino acid adenylation domain-containing protein [Phytohabitans kaempferiae]|uniref:Amino acid adenylation domain-containing protein n=1 Tax=Phytohabitans kaempferiae TaxID=1620943 RepID=A0ABV6LZG2_9ACTN